jgi:hypothetical protein
MRPRQQIEAEYLAEDTLQITSVGTRALDKTAVTVNQKLALEVALDIRDLLQSGVRIARTEKPGAARAIVKGRPKRTGGPKSFMGVGRD